MSMGNQTQMRGRIAHFARRYLTRRQKARRQERLEADLVKWPDWQLDDVGLYRAENGRTFAMGPGAEHIALAHYLSTRPR